MARVRTLILTGYGINCEEETRFAFELAGSDARIVHINDLIENRSMLADYRIFVFPGGFSYGDDTGSGKALANRIINNLEQEMAEFLSRDTLMLGICNGFQVMADIGAVPALRTSIGSPDAALTYNSTNRYQCRWVDLSVDKNSPCVFTRGLEKLHVPVAHGEGRFYAPDDVLDVLEREGMVAMRYSLSDGSPAGGHFPENPNGALRDIAAVCDRTGRVMGMMPHPERGMFFTQREDWTYLREKYRREGKELPVESDGMAIFRNGVFYFK